MATSSHEQASWSTSSQRQPEEPRSEAAQGQCNNSNSTARDRGCVTNREHCLHDSATQTRPTAARRRRAGQGGQRKTFHTLTGSGLYPDHTVEQASQTCSCSPVNTSPPVCVRSTSPPSTSHYSPPDHFSPTFEPPLLSPISGSFFPSPLPVPCTPPFVSPGPSHIVCNSGMVTRSRRSCRRGASTHGVQTEWRQGGGTETDNVGLGMDMREVSLEGSHLDFTPAPIPPTPPKVHCNVNYNARRVKMRARKVTARNKQSCVKGASQVVSVSSLEPIHAVCTPSGTGLVVTYRPVFSKNVYHTSTSRSRTRTKRGVKKQRASAPGTDAVNNNSKRDAGTDPRTPSPLQVNKQVWESGGEGTGAGERGGQERGNKRLDADKEHSVSEWLLNKIPFSTSPRITKSRSPSPGHPYHPPPRSPIPGPSWAEDELTMRSPLRPRRESARRTKQSPNPSLRPTSLTPRKKSPACGGEWGNDQDRRRGSHQTRERSKERGRKPQSVSPHKQKRKEMDGGPGWTEGGESVGKDVLASGSSSSSLHGHTGASRSTSPHLRSPKKTRRGTSGSPGRPDRHEEWVDSRAGSSPRTEAFQPRGRGRGRGGGVRVVRHNKSTSVTPSRLAQHEALSYPSRSRSFSPTLSPSPPPRPHLRDNSDTRRQHHRDRRHRRHHNDDSSANSKVMDKTHEPLCRLM